MNVSQSATAYVVRVARLRSFGLPVPGKSLTNLLLG
jgi:hypothetical protein